MKCPFLLGEGCFRGDLLRHFDAGGLPTLTGYMALG